MAERGEWYARKLYDETTPEYKHHLETYGHPSEFGYKDFIPMLKAEKFDADEWGALMHEAGAKFGGICLVHHDGFLLWDSKVSQWNSKQMGPKRDVYGEIAAAVESDVKDFSRGVPLSIRPIQWDIQTPRLHTWNVNVQQALPSKMVLTVGYAGSRGRNLLRNGDVNVPVPETLPDGTAFYPPTAGRPNRSFSAIELKSSDGQSWYDALVVELRRTSVGGLSEEAEK